MATASRRTATFSGFNVSYDTCGYGREALVFIHGWTCDSSLWHSQAPLYHIYRSILIDLLGHSKSEPPLIDYNQELFARSVKTVLEQEKIDKVVMVGHSMGGPVSSMVCRLYLELVKGIWYVESFFFSPEHYLTIEQRTKVAASLKGDGFSTYFDATWTEKSSRGMREMVIASAMSTPEHSRISAVTTNSLPHTYRWEETFDIPALLIMVSSHYQVNGAWHHHFPQLKVELWEGFSHFLFMEDANLQCTCARFLDRTQVVEKHIGINAMPFKVIWCGRILSIQPKHHSQR